MYLFDTDILSALMGSRAPSHLVRRVARIPAEGQFTTSITLGELLYGAYRRGRSDLVEKIRQVMPQAQRILSFEAKSADLYASIRADLEKQGKRLDEPDLRIASIALSRNLTLVSGNVRHFKRVPELTVENWLEP